MQQWAAMARPDVRPNQVATLLGVTPAQDAGQPVRLALSAPPAPAAPAEAFAEAAPVAADAAPVAYAAVTPVEVPASMPPASGTEGPVSSWNIPAAEATVNPVVTAEAPAASEAPSYYLPAPEAPPARTEEEVRYAAAAQTIVRPDPAMVRTASVTMPAAPVFRRESPRQTEVRGGNSRFVVQLGAFSNEGNAERAWQQVERRFGLAGRAPMTTTIAINGRTLHRVSVAGFASQSDAARLCGSIRARGGACFVRVNAGDASVRWAARYAQGRNRA
jgi:sporulation related protein